MSDAVLPPVEPERSVTDVAQALNCTYGRAMKLLVAGLSAKPQGLYIRSWDRLEGTGSPYRKPYTFDSEIAAFQERLRATRQEAAPPAEDARTAQADAGSVSTPKAAQKAPKKAKSYGRRRMPDPEPVTVDLAAQARELRRSLNAGWG